MKRIIKVVLILIAVASVVYFIAPKSGRDISTMNRPAIPASEPIPTADMSALGYVAQAGKASTDAVRKIIQRGEISLEVRDYETFFRELQKQLERSGGYVGQLQAYRNSGEFSSAKIIVRIPAGDTAIFTSWLREQGTITGENITADDVSEEYYDLSARLENARKFESRLHEMIKTSSGDLDDLVLLEEKLSSLREQIEQTEGRIRLLDRLVSLATLTLNVHVQSSDATPSVPGFSARAAKVWGSSVESLKDAAQGTALLLVAFAPWVLPLLLVAIVLRVLFRAGMKLWIYRFGR